LTQQGLELFKIGAKVYEILGLIEKVVKRKGPARVMMLLGFESNSTTGVLRIPEAKATEIVLLIHQVIATAYRGSSVPWLILSSLHGKLMWASTGIELGRSYLSAIHQPLDTFTTLLSNRLQWAIFWILVYEMIEMVGTMRPAMLCKGSLMLAPWEGAICGDPNVSGFGGQVESVGVTSTCWKPKQSCVCCAPTPAVWTIANY